MGGTVSGRRWMGPQDAIRQAATHRQNADTELTQAVAQAYGTLTVGQIAEAAGVSRPTVYALLREAGVELKGAKK
jgi:AcrR family transcriptional regulator